VASWSNSSVSAWTASIKLPAWLWNKQNKLQPQYFYVYRLALQNHQALNDSPAGTLLRYDWPP